jgi:hypothetical protein
MYCFGVCRSTTLSRSRRQQRHGQRDHRRDRRNAGKHHRQELGVVQLGDDEVDHDTALRSRN